MSTSVSYLLDTDVISEMRKRNPHRSVLEFLQRTDSSTLYLSVLTLGELRKGIALKRWRDPIAADSLSAWVDGLDYGFADRILGVDSATALVWGKLSAERSRPVIDTLLAATAIVHGLTLVTRNTADLQDIDVRLLNPFLQ